MTTNIYGSIGYTFLSTKNNDMPEHILLLADMHSQLQHCSNFKKISEWFNSKFKTSNILLEEVPRTKDIQLKGLFEESEHTTELRDLYLNNTDIIKAVDIRPYLIPFSWEFLTNEKELGNLKLNEYLKLIDSFFMFEHKKIKEDIGNIYRYGFDNVQQYIKNNNKFLKNKLMNLNSKSSECDIVKLINIQGGQGSEAYQSPLIREATSYHDQGDKENKLNIHFTVIKCIYKKFKIKYKNYLDHGLLDILQNNKNILEEINYHLDNIMEFYVILKIFALQEDLKHPTLLIKGAIANSNKKNIIIHTGLVHSEKILDWLTNVYNYNIVSNYGVNNIDDISKITSGCFAMPKSINDKF